MGRIGRMRRMRRKNALSKQQEAEETPEKIKKPPKVAQTSEKERISMAQVLPLHRNHKECTVFFVFNFVVIPLNTPKIQARIQTRIQDSASLEMKIGAISHRHFCPDNAGDTSFLFHWMKRIVAFPTQAKIGRKYPFSPCYFMFFVLFFLLTSCGIHVIQENQQYGFYYVNDYTSTGEALHVIIRFLPESKEEISGFTLLEAHMKYGLEVDVKSPYPSGTQLLRIEEGEEQILHVYFSQEYGELAGMDKTIADYAVVATLTQLPYITAVRIFVIGEEAEDVPLLQREDVVSLPPFPL